MIFQGDLRIKAMLTLGFEDIAKNPWLIDSILADTVSDEYMRRFYGTQIASCKQWIANNRINIVLSDRDDKLEFPAIEIELGTSNEKSELKHMGDLSYQSVRLMPNNINKPISFVLNPTAGSYNPSSGVFTFSTPVDLNNVSPKMILVNPSNGNGYIIQSVTMANQVNLLTGLSIPTANYGIIPEYQFYEAKIGHSFFQEPYRIVCSGLDQQTLLWLHSIAVYSLLRYRQVLLEKAGYAESLISSSKMYPNPDRSDSAQTIWSRDITLTGQIENRWIMEPHRILENVAIGNGNGLEGGVKIISNITDTFEDLSTVNWSTLAAVAEAGDE